MQVSKVEDPSLLSPKPKLLTKSAIEDGTPQKESKKKELTKTGYSFEQIILEKYEKNYGKVPSVFNKAEQSINNTIQFKLVYQNIQAYNTLTAFLIGVGTLICIFQYDHEYAEINPIQSWAYLSLVTFCTAVACFISYLKYKSKTILGVLEGKFPLDATLWETTLWKKLVFDWVFFLFQPYPFLIGIRVYVWNPPLQDYIYYHVNDFLHMLSILRVIYVAGRPFNLSSYMSSSSYRVW